MKRWLVLILVIIICFIFTGCWNYREIDSLSIVAGIGIDRDSETGDIVLSIEIINPSESSGQTSDTKILESRGKTVFDAVRDAIEISGKRLFWQHADTFIVGEEVAKEGLLDMLDWLYRESEVRLSFHLLVAQGCSAKDIMTAKSVSNDPLSFEIRKKLENKKNIEKYPSVKLYEVIKMLKFDVPYIYLPSIRVTEQGGVNITQICGTAVFKRDKLKGYLDLEDSKYFLYVLDQIKGGLLVNKTALNNPDANVSMEIFSSKTTVKPIYQDGKITMSIKVKTEVAVDEVGPDVDITEKTGLGLLKEDMQSFLEQNIARVIQKVQNEFDADIFGFGPLIYQNMPNIWKQYKDNWDNEFKKLNFTVSSDIKIRNTATLSKSLGGAK